MSRARSLVVLAVLASLLAALPSSAQATPKSTLMVKKINEVRRAHGVGPVRVSRSLKRSSFAYSRRLMGGDYFAHGSRIRASRRFRLLGEVLELHGGRRPRVARTVRQWLRSPSHRAALLNPAWRQVGAGRTYGRFRGQRTTIWVVQFGRR